MKKRIFKMAGVLVALALMLGLVVTPAMAATEATVTVTATPEYIAMTNAPSSWTINNITGTGVIQTNTTYYANPLGDTTPPSATVSDTECQFTITNTSTVVTDVFIHWGSFTGGDANMTNSDAGTNGATTYGAYSWHEGMTYASKVVCKSTGSVATEEDLAATTDLDWGVEILTRTDAWTGGSSSTASLTVGLAAA